MDAFIVFCLSCNVHPRVIHSFLKSVGPSVSQSVRQTQDTVFSQSSIRSLHEISTRSGHDL